MRKKPFSIKFFACCFLLAPFVNLFISGWVNQWPLTGPRGVLEHLSLYERIVLIVFMVVAYGIWRVVKWGYFLFIGFSLLIIAHNFYVLIESQAYSRYLVLLFQVTTLSTVGFFLQKHITAPYFNPKLRWWESLPRYRLDVAARIKLGKDKIDGVVVDVSRGGCFIKSGVSLNLEQPVSIEFTHKAGSFSSRGIVLWVSDKVKNGYGVKFLKTSVKSKWILKKIIKTVKSKKYSEHSGSQVA